MLTGVFPGEDFTFSYRNFMSDIAQQNPGWSVLGQELH
jgi:hypothetical protein